MEEKKQQRNRKNRKSTSEKPDYFLFVTLTQCLIAAVVCILLLVLSRGDSARAAGLRSDYALLLSRQLSMEDIADSVSMIRDYFLPQAGTVPVMAQPEMETTLPDETTEQADPEENEVLTTTGEEIESTQPATTQSLKTAASKAKETAEDSATGSAPHVQKTAVSASAVTVPIIRPVEGGRYSSYYGYRNNPITHQYALHTGLDIAVPEGSAIRAAYGGTVRLVGEDERSGKYVTITHDDGYETFYCHCSKTLVREGAFVNAGEVVACVGSTGWATGPHLHFEIRKDGEKLDPLQILEHDV